MDAIVYTSETGHTREYAYLLGKATGLKVLSLKEAVEKLPRDSSILYLGWLMAGMIRGLKKASARFDVQGICCVGMALDAAQLADVRRTARLSESMPLFYLEGGFEMDKLHGLYRFMMRCMMNTVGKKTEKLKERDAQQQDMLDLFQHGQSRVDAAKLKAVLEWLSTVDKG